MKNHTVATESRVILFTDIHDFSIVANVLGKSHYGYIQEVFEKLGDIIVQYQGEIIKYLGDAMLCIFPADAEVQAIRCALQMRQAYAGIVNARAIPYDTELEVGVGSGEVQLGIFGHRSFRQRDLFGEEVNRAAVIGHHLGVAITENVYHKIKGQFKTRELPPKTVKWHDQPLRTWEILE